ncbi:hypothetical protein A2165_00315 [Candidatus Curtissbacteria bacterium RBG_13_40_7]|uniref:DUF721 domain-containing protein n=1 Tax=Candidatus Curtissbacteria bacterium RBG_13_40_7 TaxID=1797706 RepID=A0A1F5FWD2_9BACT|nr:MAG: hypothetical protein A2165_00315 [Candidatus Curtissbacteria bacterium RBG_13_40_7]
MFKTIGSLIKEIPTRHRTPQAIVALQVRQAARESLKTVCSDLPKEIMELVKVSSFKNGVLTLSAPVLVSSELHTRSEGLIEEINRALGKKFIGRLRFKIR